MSANKWSPAAIVGMMLLGLVIGLVLLALLFGGWGGYGLMGRWGWGMMGPGMMGGWATPFGWFFMLLWLLVPLAFLALLILGIVWLVRAVSPPPSEPPK